MADPEELESTAGVDAGADGDGEYIPCIESTPSDVQVRPHSNNSFKHVP